MQNSSFLHLNLLKGHGCKYTDLFRIGLKNRIKTTFPPLCERFRHTRRLYSRIERNKGRSSYKEMAFFEYGTARYPPATGCGSHPQHIPRQLSGTHIPPRLVSFFENRSVDEHSVEIGPIRTNGFPLETYAGIQSLYII